MILKVLRIGDTDDKDWKEVFDMINYASSYKHQLTDEQLKKHKVNVEKFNQNARRACNTNNVVSVNMNEEDEKLLFIELDYLYNGEELSVKEVFLEDEQLYAKVE